MKKIELKYPWCTGVPRPTIISNLDAGEVIISYYTAPICQHSCKSGVIIIKGITSVESYYLNDDENKYLKSGLIRDSIYVKTDSKKNKYLFLLHNEYLVIKGDLLEEYPGEDSFIKNLYKYHNSEFERD